MGLLGVNQSMRELSTGGGGYCGVYRRKYAESGPLATLRRLAVAAGDELLPRIRDINFCYPTAETRQRMVP